MDLHHKIIYENKMLKVAMVNNQWMIKWIEVICRVEY